MNTEKFKPLELLAIEDESARYEADGLGPLDHLAVSAVLYTCALERIGDQVNQYGGREILRDLLTFRVQRALMDAGFDPTELKDTSWWEEVNRAYWETVAWLPVSGRPLYITRQRAKPAAGAKRRKAA